MPATAVTIQDFWPKNDMPTLDIYKKCHTYAFLDIYYRTFTIAISPGGNDFKGIISKVPGGNSYCEASMIDIKNRCDRTKIYAVSFQMAQTRPFYLV